MVDSLACSAYWPCPVTCLLAVNVTAFRPGQGQRLIGRLATFTRLTRTERLTRIARDYELRAPSLHLWASPSVMSGRTCSNEKLVDTVRDMLVDLTHSNHRVLERSLVRDIVDCHDVVCVLVVVSRGPPETLLFRSSVRTGILN